MDLLTAFGLFAVSAMLVMYVLEQRNYRYRLGFSVACILGSVYGFAQGAWPFGLVELVWAVAAAWEWHKHHARYLGLKPWFSSKD